MKNYNAVKAELKSKAGNTRYFNKAFWNVYQAAMDTIKRNAENEIDDYYLDNGIWTRHAYDEIRRTPFYEKNGSAYCAFLEIMA